MDHRQSQETVFVHTFTNGVLDPGKPMLGPVRDGGHIVANTAPGCWGPMITPALRGGHEVTQPVYVEGAEVGDSIAIRIQSIRCVKCGADATPFTFTHGYTIAFDAGGTLGVTLPQEAAERIAGEGRRYMATPENSIQNPVVTFAPHDLVGAVARLRPFLGQIGTTPSRALPDSHNAGDFGFFLVGAPHEYAVTMEQLNEAKTDGHMDISRVREGAVLICPVKVPGGGVYLGDMHALQGDGEIAGHTCDVSGIVTLQVHVIKGLALDGPLLLPKEEDLPYLAKPLSVEEKEAALREAEKWGVHHIEETAPVSFVGSGENLNAATDNALERAAGLLMMTVPEVKNRATITGSIEIGRHPGVVTVTFLVPVDRLRRLGMMQLIREQYQM